MNEKHGPLVILPNPAARAHASFVAVVTDPDVYREIFTRSDIWRGVKIMFNGIKGHASRRLAYSMTRLRGARHAHYRRLLMPMLKRGAVEAQSEAMAATIADHVRHWPRGAPVDLPPLTERLAHDLSVQFLFGNDRQRALPIADMIRRQGEGNWYSAVLRHLAWLPLANRQEQAIMRWAEALRGRVDMGNVVSILANSPDENGEPPSREIIGGLTSFIFGASFDTCQNGLAWTLILLTQHPEIAESLATEIRSAVGTGLATIERIGELPLLDGVVKESLRLFPPVPLQGRRAMMPTTVAGEPIADRTLALVSIHAMCRNPVVFPDPDRFVPTRWRGLDLTPYAYPVFGVGAYMCPGMLFGTQMIKLGVAAILSRCSIAAAPGARIDYRTAITLAPRGKVQVVLADAEKPVRWQAVRGAFRGLVELPN
ncbi:MAG: cytochrome P450 [Xanthobacteraceae bacterium]